MKKLLLSTFLFLSSVSLYSQPLQFDLPAVKGTTWFKGNTHTHTTNSDGDTGPDTVVAWYKSHGYNFLVLSDHNVFTDPTKLAYLNESNFLLISGEELTSSFQSKPVHVNGLNIPHVLEEQRDSTLLGTIQKNVDEVRKVAGVPHINHPNFRWAFDHEILQHVKNDRLLEIFNGHPLVHNGGGGGKLSMEAVWDKLLTSGKRMYGIAVDDAHHFEGEFSRGRSNPGRGWICVKTNSLSAKEIMANLEEGMFYASTGVMLQDVVLTSQSLEVIVKPEADFRYVIEFIGEEGKVLKRVEDINARFELDRTVSYVRAKVTDSGGAVASVQPLFVKE